MFHHRYGRYGTCIVYRIDAISIRVVSSKFIFKFWWISLQYLYKITCSKIDKDQYPWCDGMPAIVLEHVYCFRAERDYKNGAHNSAGTAWRQARVQDLHRLRVRQRVYGGEHWEVLWLPLNIHGHIWPVLRSRSEVPERFIPSLFLFQLLISFK